jgi:hypothetical protein
MNKSRTTHFALICCIAAWAPTVARASLIDGSQLHISGDLLVGAISFTWQCNQPSDPACVTPPSGAGDFTVSAASTGSFAEYNSTFGLVADINNGSEPLNTTFSLPNFMTFDNNDLTVELTFVSLGNDTVSTNCAGLIHCTPQNFLLVTPNNPQGLFAFDLDQNAMGTALTFDVIGVVHQAGGATGALSGMYTSEFLGLDPQDTLTFLESGGAFTYSADLTMTVAQASAPEPMSILLSGIGLIGLGLVSRGRRG